MFKTIKFVACLLCSLSDDGNPVFFVKLNAIILPLQAKATTVREALSKWVSGIHKYTMQ